MRLVSGSSSPFTILLWKGSWGIHPNSNTFAPRNVSIGTVRRKRGVRPGRWDVGNPPEPDSCRAPSASARCAGTGGSGLEWDQGPRNRNYGEGGLYNRITGKLLLQVDAAFTYYTSVNGDKCRSASLCIYCCCAMD